MRKAISIVCAAAFLSGAAVTLTPAPAAAFAPLFFVPVLMSKEDKNFKPVNPYAKKASHHHKHKAKKM